MLWIAGSLVIFMILTIVMYNGIIRKFNNAKRGWSDVINYEKNKLTLISKLEDALKQYSAYEGEIMSDIVKLRNSVNVLKNNEIDVDGLLSVNNISNQLLDRVKLNVENYPDLKAATLYNQFMNEWSDACKNVAAAISIFNLCVAEFNNSIQVFPSNIVNSIIAKKQPLKEFSDIEASSSFGYKPNFN